MVGRNVGQRSTGGGGHGISAVAWITGEDVDCVSARRAGEGTTCLRVLIANGPSINGRLHFLEALPSLESVGPWFGAHGICPSRLQAQTQHFLLIPALAGFLSWAAAVCRAVPPAACFPSFPCLSASFSRSLFFFTLRAFLSLKVCTEMNRLSQGPTGWLLLSAASALALCRCLLR